MLCCAQGKHSQQHKKAKMIHVSFSISALFYYHDFLPKQPQPCATLCSDAVSVSELVLLLQSSSPAVEPAQPRGCPSEGSRVPGSSIAASPSAAWCSSRGPSWRERAGEKPGSPLCLCSSSRILGGPVPRQLFLQPVLACAWPHAPRCH